MTGLVKIQNQTKPCVTIAVSNDTKHDITLTRKMALGTLQPIERILDAKTTNEHLPTVAVGEVTVEPAESPSLPWQPPVKLDHLEEEQREVVERMLFEECRAFARDGKDIGCNPDLQMVINLKYDIPVQRTYNFIPKPLLREAKEYVQDLLVREWIVNPSRLMLHQLCVCGKKTVHSVSA